MATDSFLKGQSLCDTATASSMLSRLASSKAATLKAINVSIAGRFDPLFLPKEIFYMIFGIVRATTKRSCSKVSKGWKQELEAEPSIWRVIDSSLASGSKGMTIVKLSSLYSRKTLETVKLRFQNNRQAEIDGCLKMLEESSSTLQSLNFHGSLKNSELVFGALDLASRCIKLQELVCTVAEEVEVASTEEDSDREEMDYYERREWVIEEHHSEVCLDEFEFESYPSVIDLSSSLLTSIFVGSCLLFSRAKTIDLDFSSTEESLKQSDIFRLLDISSGTLESLFISQKCIPRDLRPWHRSEFDFGKEIQLEKLLELEIKSSEWEDFKKVSTFRLWSQLLKLKRITSM